MLLCFSAKEIPGLFRNNLSFIDSKETRLCSDWNHSSCVKNSYPHCMRWLEVYGGKPTVLSISKIQDTMELDVFSLKVFKSLVHFFPFWTKTRNQFSIDWLCFQGAFKKVAWFSSESLEAFVTIYQLDVRRNWMCSSFYKSDWLLQVGSALDRWLSSQLTSPVFSLIDDFPFLSWWNEANKCVFCCCGSSDA